MKNEEQKIKVLFSKFLNEECSKEEIFQILEYFKHEKQDEKLKELVRLGLESEVSDLNATEAVEEVYNALLSDIRTKKSTRGAILPLVWQRAAVWLLLLTTVGMAFYFWQRSAGIVMEEVVTRSAERKNITLHDGTKVWLNAGSRLRYPRQFAPASREVILEGEAYFEVARIPEQPFLITTGELKTKVLGTSFNISAYKENQTISVSVLTGKVAVSSSGAEMELVPDQQAVFDRKKMLLTREDKVTASDMVGWKEGKTRFRNTTFAEVIATLQRSYGVNISYDPVLEKCPVVHADFDRDEPIQKVLEMLLISVDGRVKHDKNNYHLTGTGCPI